MIKNLFKKHLDKYKYEDWIHVYVGKSQILKLPDDISYDVNIENFKFFIIDGFNQYEYLEKDFPIKIGDDEGFIQLDSIDIKYHNNVTRRMIRLINLRSKDIDEINFLLEGAIRMLHNPDKYRPIH